MFNKLKYFVTDGIKASVAERIIIQILLKHKISFLREVSFIDFISPRGGYYRYDFYFPDKNLIIEYDGKRYHKAGNTKDIDKNLFCAINGIRLVRFNNKHYYQLEKHLLKLLKKY